MHDGMAFLTVEQSFSPPKPEKNGNNK